MILGRTSGTQRESVAWSRRPCQKESKELSEDGLSPQVAIKVVGFFAGSREYDYFLFVRLRKERSNGFSSLGALSQENLNRPQCISINSAYIYDMVPLTPEYPDGSDVCAPVTIAHELGHYLGLRHVFSESYMGCRDTDYCDDTPTYDRNSYTQLVYAYWGTPDFKNHLDELIERECCTDGSVFVSDNIMDYSVSYSNRFTSEQAARIRYILEKGVFVPGPKNRSDETKSTRSIGKLDLPMTIMK